MAKILYEVKQNQNEHNAAFGKTGAASLLFNLLTRFLLININLGQFLIANIDIITQKLYLCALEYQ